MSDRAARARIREERQVRRQTFLASRSTPTADPHRHSAPAQFNPGLPNTPTPSPVTNPPTIGSFSTPTGLQLNRNPGTKPESLQYIITEVFDFPPDSILATSLDYHGVETFVGLAALTISMIDNMTYPVSQAPDEDGDAQPDVEQPLPFELKAVLKGFIGYISYRENVLRHPITV